MNTSKLTHSSFELESINRQLQSRAELAYKVYIDTHCEYLQVQATSTSVILADGISNEELAGKLHASKVRMIRDRLEFLSSYRAMVHFADRHRFKLLDWSKFTGGRDALDNEILLKALKGI
jgi:hypothetical protein